MSEILAFFFFIWHFAFWSLSTLKIRTQRRALRSLSLRTGSKRNPTAFPRSKVDCNHCSRRGEARRASRGLGLSRRAEGSHGSSNRCKGPAIPPSTAWQQINQDQPCASLFPSNPPRHHCPHFYRTHLTHAPAGCTMHTNANDDDDDGFPKPSFFLLFLLSASVVSTHPAFRSSLYPPAQCTTSETASGRPRRRRKRWRWVESKSRDPVSGKSTVRMCVRGWHRAQF